MSEVEVKNNTLDVFLALLRAGLWEQGVSLKQYCPIDFEELFQLSDDQSVIGLVSAGLEHVEDLKITKPQALPFLKRIVSLESRNSSMNHFISEIVDEMSKNGIYAILVKGQGIAQYYERPLWRASGDVDFLFDLDNYEKAKTFMRPKANHIELEDFEKKHIGMTIGPWVVELHGTLHCGLTRRANQVIDSIQEDTIAPKKVINWQCGNTIVPVPGSNNNVIFIFSHILQHFFHGGVGLRQICDWCRLLWTLRNEIDNPLLESRIKEMRLMTEWKSFASLAVNFLGLTADAMPFYDDSVFFKRKACKILSIIIEKGNFGHKVDSSYMSKTPPLRRKIITVFRQFKEAVITATLFPLDAIRFFCFFLIDGVARTKVTTTFRSARHSDSFIS